MKCRNECVLNQSINCECVSIVMQICCYNKCGIVLKEFNPHLPKGFSFLRDGEEMAMHIGVKGNPRFEFTFIEDDGG
jgi:hypothetical protein